MLLPDEAIGTDQTNKFVYVVGDDGTVARRNVKLGPLHEGLRVVREGVDGRGLGDHQRAAARTPGRQGHAQARGADRLRERRPPSRSSRRRNEPGSATPLQSEPRNP